MNKRSLSIWVIVLAAWLRAAGMVWAMAEATAVSPTAIPFPQQSDAADAAALKNSSGEQNAKIN